MNCCSLTNQQVAVKPMIDLVRLWHLWFIITLCFSPCVCVCVFMCACDRDLTNDQKHSNCIQNKLTIFIYC